MELFLLVGIVQYSLRLLLNSLLWEEEEEDESKCLWFKIIIMVCFSFAVKICLLYVITSNFEILFWSDALRNKIMLNTSNTAESAFSTNFFSLQNNIFLRVVFL